MDRINQTPPTEGGFSTHQMLLDQSHRPEPLPDVPNVATAFLSTGLRLTPYPLIVLPPLPPLGFGLDPLPYGFGPAAFSSNVTQSSAGFQSGPPLGSTQIHTNQFNHTNEFDYSNEFDITTPSNDVNQFDNTTEFDNSNHFYSTN